MKKRTLLTWLDLSLSLLVLLCLLRSARADTTVTEKADQRGSPRIKLLNDGSGRKQLLRIQPALNMTARSEFLMRWAIEIDDAKKLPRSQMPPIKITYDGKVTDVSSEGDIRYDLTISNAEIVSEPGVSAQVEAATRKLRKSIGPLKGAISHIRVTSRNATKEADFALPGDTDPQLRQAIEGLKQSMNQMEMPLLPEEPVGLGARWEARNSITNNGIVLDQIDTYTITALAGRNLTVKVAKRAVAKPQDMKLPSMPAGYRMHLDSMIMKGAGEVTLDLSEFLPRLMTVTGDTEMQMTLHHGAQHQQASTKFELDIRFDSTPARTATKVAQNR